MDRAREQTRIGCHISSVIPSFLWLQIERSVFHVHGFGERRRVAQNPSAIFTGELDK
jgi:hypothetical protein